MRLALAVSAGPQLLILGSLLFVQNGPNAIAGLLTDAFDFALFFPESRTGLIENLRELSGLIWRQIQLLREPLHRAHAAGSRGGIRPCRANRCLRFHPQIGRHGSRESPTEEDQNDKESGFFSFWLPFPFPLSGFRDLNQVAHHEISIMTLI